MPILTPAVSPASGVLYCTTCSSSHHTTLPQWYSAVYKPYCRSTYYQPLILLFPLSSCFPPCSTKVLPLRPTWLLKTLISTYTTVSPSRISITCSLWVTMLYTTKCYWLIVGCFQHYDHVEQKCKNPLIVYWFLWNYVADAGEQSTSFVRIRM